MTIGVLVAFMQYAQRFFRPIQDLSEKFNILQSAMAAGERVFKLLDTKVEVTSPAVTKQPQGPGRIEFDHVWFAYNAPQWVNAQLAPPAECLLTNPEPDWVLRDVNFSLDPGETIAVVGHTGAGKTTLISLLMRFYDVQRGAIRIDGVDVTNGPCRPAPSFWRRLAGSVFVLGHRGQQYSAGYERIADQDSKRLPTTSILPTLSARCPDGFDEEVRERGSTLSTGQKQLISFARALAHNPEILILDEATSSVDTETEFRVREALDRMIEGRTSIIIAHRLSTVQRADKIIVMHKGQVREMGSHQQLLAQRGIYYKLYQLQYKDQELALGPQLPPFTVSADD